MENDKLAAPVGGKSDAGESAGMEIRQLSIPSGLLAALAKKRLTYTRPATVYHTVWSDGPILVGVFGDGANGAYEWFIWDDDAKSVRTSDVGFGDDFIALCCGLVEAGARRANGDHELFLTWERRA